MHRIPHGKQHVNNPGKKRPVMFLQHGLEASSSNFVTQLPYKALAYMAADAGFDVWMGNARGNLYSMGHDTLNISEHPYWEFSWDQMEMYDLEAMVNHVLKTTDNDDLYYVGHSQGTLMMFSKLADQPEWKNKIRKYFAMAPVGTVKDIAGALRFIADDLFTEAEALLELLGRNEFMPPTPLTKLLKAILCKDSPKETLCDNLIFLIMGPESNQMNYTRMDVYLSDHPSGTSTQNILHWAQMVRSGLQQRYDWGSAAKNIEKYGTPVPPIIDISKIETDMYLYWSDDDWLADTQDVENHLLKNLNPRYLKQNNKLTHFNHVDFCWGERAAEEVYVPLLKIAKEDADSRGIY